MAAGSYSVSSGRITLDDAELHRLPKHRIAHAGLSRTYQNIRLFDGMTVLQNLEVALVPVTTGAILAEMVIPGKRAERVRRRDKCFATLERLGIERHAERQAGSLAYGEQKLVELARAIVPDPKVILLDEPAARPQPRGNGAVETPHSRSQRAEGRARSHRARHETHHGHLGRDLRHGSWCRAGARFAGGSPRERQSSGGLPWSARSHQRR